MGNINNCVVARLDWKTEVDGTQALEDARGSGYPYTCYWLVKALFAVAPTEWKEKFDIIPCPPTDSTTVCVIIAPVVGENVRVDIPEYAVEGLSIYDARDVLDKYVISYSRLVVHTNRSFYPQLLKDTVECMKIYHDMVRDDTPFKAGPHSDMNEHIDVVELLSVQVGAPTFLGIMLVKLREIQHKVEGGRSVCTIRSGSNKQRVTFSKEGWVFDREMVELIKGCVTSASPTLREEREEERKRRREEHDAKWRADHPSFFSDRVDEVDVVPQAEEVLESSSSEDPVVSESDDSEEEVDPLVPCWVELDRIIRDIPTVDGERECSYEHTVSAYRWY